MPIYEVTDPKTNKTLEFDGEAPPSEAIIKAAFGIANKQDKATSLDAEVPATETTTDKSFLENVGEAISKRATKSADAWSKHGISKAPVAAALTISNVAGGVGDIAGASLASLYKTITPSSLQRDISGVASNVAQNPLLRGAMSQYQAFKEKFPDSAEAAEGILNLIGLGLVKKPATSVLGETAKVAGDIKSGLLPKNPVVLSKKLDKVIADGMDKSIKPSVAGKNSVVQINAYKSKTNEAVKSIIENKDNLKFVNDLGEETVGALPQNLKQFNEAIDQTKRYVFQQYDELAQTSGLQGVTVEMDPVVNELKNIANNKVLLSTSPSTAEYALKRAEDFGGVRFTATEAQDAIKIMNQSLDTFYKNPSYDTASRAYVDSLIVNNIRKNLDDAIGKTAGDGYQELKNKYGALRTIEADVSKRSVVDARKNIKGIIDFSDIFSGSSALHGILSMNPQVVASAGFAKMIASIYKRMNDPNIIIKKMFNNAEKLTNQKNEALRGFNPTSATFKYLRGDTP